MKKITFIFFVFILSMTSQAQVQLLHEFENINNCLFSHMSFETVYEPSDCYITVKDSSIRIYNSDFVLTHTININTSDFSWHPNFHPNRISGLVVTPVGRHLINTDEKIEMLVYIGGVAMAYDNYDEYEYEYIDESSTIIINEDGTVIHDFGCFIDFGDDGYSTQCIVHKVGNQLRLAGYASIPVEYDEYGYVLRSATSLKIYSLGGSYNPSTMVTYTQPSSSLNPYPNPSRNTITLPYTLQSGETAQLKVFNMSGQLLETFNIGSDFDKIELNVSNYAKGTYIYTYNGVSKKFVVR